MGPPSRSQAADAYDCIMVQAASWTLKEQVRFEGDAIVSRKEMRDKLTYYLEFLMARQKRNHATP